jgi:hypothetical protein
VWQATAVGKLNNIKAFIKYIYFTDYSSSFKNETPTATIHEELVSNLVILIKQNIPIQDIVEMNHILKNIWFFLEITLKSLCLYTIQFKSYHRNSMLTPTFSTTFYESLRQLYEVLTDLIVKCVTTSSSSNKDHDILNSFKSCNQSLALFVKKSMNVLNKKFVFVLINKYLDSFHLCDKVSSFLFIK